MSHIEYPIIFEDYIQNKKFRILLIQEECVVQENIQGIWNITVQYSTVIKVLSYYINDLRKRSGLFTIQRFSKL